MRFSGSGLITNWQIFPQLVQARHRPEELCRFLRYPLCEEVFGVGSRALGCVQPGFLARRGLLRQYRGGCGFLLRSLGGRGGLWLLSVFCLAGSRCGGMQNASCCCVPFARLQHSSGPLRRQAQQLRESYASCLKSGSNVFPRD